jgi:hypothetical protein
MTADRNKAVSETVNKAKSFSRDNTFALSTGVVFKAIRVPSMVFPELMARMERPKPPRVFIADIGREEENPSDPDYIAKLDVFNAEYTKAIIDTMIVLGTEVLSVPDDIKKDNDELWLKKLKALRMFPEDEIQRYLLWVKTVAAPLDDDIQSIMREVGRLSGVSEEDVSEAVETFRDNPER